MGGLIENPVSYAENVVGKDPFATFLGVQVEEVREGYARCSITIKPEYLNAVERAHGAAVFAVVDQAFAVASNSTGNMAVAVNFNINYIAAAIDGEKIFAEAVPLNIGRKLSVWQIEVRGLNDKLIAAGQGTVYHK
jgi:acyl-CoA thioesterase